MNQELEKRIVAQFTSLVEQVGQVFKFTIYIDFLFTQKLF